MKVLVFVFCIACIVYVGYGVCWRVVGSSSCSRPGAHRPAGARAPRRASGERARRKELHRRAFGKLRVATATGKARRARGFSTVPAGSRYGQSRGLLATAENATRSRISPDRSTYSSAAITAGPTRVGLAAKGMAPRRPHHHAHPGIARKPPRGTRKTRPEFRERARKAGAFPGWIR